MAKNLPQNSTLQRLSTTLQLRPLLRDFRHTSGAGAPPSDVWSRQQSLTLSQGLGHSPHFISSRGRFIISRHHNTKGECSPGRCFERERGHVYITFIIVYCYNSSVLLMLFYSIMNYCCSCLTVHHS